MGDNCAYTPGQGKCDPCESLDKSSLLATDVLMSQLSSSRPLWAMGRVGEIVIDEGDKKEEVVCISRSFVCKNFQCALDVMNSAGAICEFFSHHADFHLSSYRTVTILIYTHSVKGVTMNDIELAKALDEGVKIAYSPKWLKEHPEASDTALPQAKKAKE